MTDTSAQSACVGNGGHMFFMSLRAEPHYGVICRVLRHERGEFPVTVKQDGRPDKDVVLPWCVTCRRTDGS